MCMTNFPVQKERSRRVNPEADYTEDPDIAIRQFRDLLDLARNAEDLNAYNEALDITPQETERYTARRTGTRREPIQQQPRGPFGFGGQVGQVNPGQTHWQAGPMPWNQRYRDVPVYESRPNEAPISVSDEFYNNARGMSEEEIAQLATAFAQDVRGGDDIAGIYDRYGVGDMAGHSRGIRRGERANAIRSFSTEGAIPVEKEGIPGQAQSTGAAPGVPGQGSIADTLGISTKRDVQRGGGAGRTKVPQTIFRAGLKGGSNDSVRNIT